MTRDLHPVAWWGWAIGVALAAGLTTNPLLLGLLFCSIWPAVASKTASDERGRIAITRGLIRRLVLGTCAESGRGEWC